MLPFIKMHTFLVTAIAHGFLFVCWLEANGIQELTVLPIFLSKVCKLLQPAHDIATCI